MNLRCAIGKLRRSPRGRGAVARTRSQRSGGCGPRVNPRDEFFRKLAAFRVDPLRTCQRKAPSYLGRCFEWRDRLNGGLAAPSASITLGQAWNSVANQPIVNRRSGIVTGSSGRLTLRRLPSDALPDVALADRVAVARERVRIDVEMIQVDRRAGRLDRCAGRVDRNDPRDTLRG